MQRAEYLCARCGARVSLDLSLHYIRCPHCNSSRVLIKSRPEGYVKRIKVI